MLVNGKDSAGKRQRNLSATVSAIRTLIKKLR